MKQIEIDASELTLEQIILEVLKYCKSYDEFKFWSGLENEGASVLWMQHKIK